MFFVVSLNKFVNRQSTARWHHPHVWWTRKLAARVFSYLTPSVDAALQYIGKLCLTFIPIFNTRHGRDTLVNIGSGNVFTWTKYLFGNCFITSLQWRHNGRNGVPNHQPHHCLLNRLFRRILKKASNFRVIGPVSGNSPVTGEFPAQMASNAEMFPFDDVIMIHWYNKATNQGPRHWHK